MAPRHLCACALLLHLLAFVVAAAAAAETVDYGCQKNGDKCCFDARPGCAKCGADARRPSRLFGCKGELWSPRDRLVYEWSWAGYQQGSADPPSPPATVNLKTE
jgi:hypothetical protein